MPASFSTTARNVAHFCGPKQVIVVSFVPTEISPVRLFNKTAGELREGMLAVRASSATLVNGVNEENITNTQVYKAVFKSVWTVPVPVRNVWIAVSATPRWRIACGSA
jgi:hypothetical protein